MGNTTYFNISDNFAQKNTHLCQHIDTIFAKRVYILYFLCFANRFYVHFGTNIDTKTYLVFRSGESVTAQSYGKPAF